MNYTQEQLAEIGQKEVQRKAKQKAYDLQYNARTKWEREQYKNFALSNGFVLPEFPGVE